MYARVMDAIGLSGVSILSASVGIVWAIYRKEDAAYKRAIGR